MGSAKSKLTLKVISNTIRPVDAHMGKSEFHLLLSKIEYLEQEVSFLKEETNRLKLSL